MAIDNQNQDLCEIPLSVKVRKDQKEWIDGQGEGFNFSGWVRSQIDKVKGVQNVQP